MEKKEIQTENRRFGADIFGSVLSEIDRAFNYETVRCMRNEELSEADTAKIIRESAEWLKGILPAYIDNSAANIMTVIGACGKQ